MMKIDVRFCFCLILLLLGVHCGPNETPFSSRGSLQPSLLAMNPPSGSVLDNFESLHFIFSRPMDLETINENTLVILEDSQLGNATHSDLSAWSGTGSLLSKGHLQSENGGESVIYTLDEGLNPGRYHIFLSKDVQSADHFSLNQGPLDNDFYYVGWVELKGNNKGQESAQNEDFVGQDDEEIISKPKKMETESVPEFEFAGDVIFNEIVTDPQRDWNDSANGNGIAFDEIPGMGSVGSTDEWIELKNISNSSLNISGWKIFMVDGTDEQMSLNENYVDLFFSQDGSLESFEPDELLVIGNPPGDMKNAITLMLIDQNEDVVDELNVEDGNATSEFDESLNRQLDGSLTQNQATPGWE